MWIAVIILAIINLFLFHSVFHVFYFDLGKGLVKEIITACVVACMELVIIIIGGQWVIGLLGSAVSGILALLGIFLKIILIIVGVGAGIFVFRLIYKKIKDFWRRKKERKNVFKTNSSYEKKDNENLNSDNVISEVKPANENKNSKKNIEQIHNEDKMFCPYCGKKNSRRVKYCCFCGKEIKYNKKYN